MRWPATSFPSSRTTSRSGSCRSAFCRPRSCWCPSTSCSSICSLIDTWTGLILCYSAFNLAFVVVIMRDIFRDVSTEIEDAAKVEGATPWQIFWMIALPLSLDGLVVSSVLVFAFTLERGLVRFGVDLAGGRSVLRARSRLPLDARRRFQHRRGQHADRHHSAGDLLSSSSSATLPAACRSALSKDSSWRGLVRQNWDQCTTVCVWRDRNVIRRGKCPP